jgi:hypothetical protein
LGILRGGLPLVGMSGQPQRLGNVARQISLFRTAQLAAAKGTVVAPNGG